MNQNPQTYRILTVEDTKFDPDNYGNRFYSVSFEGYQGKYLWKTKNRPESGTAVFGHVEPSKSGKSMIFKKDQKPDDYREPQQPVSEQALINPQPSGAFDIQDALRKIYKLTSDLKDLTEAMHNDIQMLTELRSFSAPLEAAKSINGTVALDTIPTADSTTGFDKFQAARQKAKSIDPNDYPDDPAEFIDDDMDKPISEDEIPF